MSEYQYYEFRAIDRPLEGKEMDELRRLSTRAEITPVSFTNTYQWGDFKGDPSVLMKRYFDAFVYVANWGTNRLMLRVPSGFLDIKTIDAYCDGEDFSYTSHKDHVVLEFSSHDEGGDDGWTEGEHWMPSLISLRAELMRGDLRSLYLAWLATFPQRGWHEPDDSSDDEHEPPVPPGLAKLSAAQTALADFLRIDGDLLEVAASRSTGHAPASPSYEEMARWVNTLTTSEKDAYLARFLSEDGDVLLRAELSKRFREATAPRNKKNVLEAEQRTVVELLTSAKALAKERLSKSAAKEAADRARREREKVEERTKHLDRLAQRGPAVWREIDQLIATKSPKKYDEAVALLADLRDLAERSGRLDETLNRIHELRLQHAKKPSLIERFRNKQLGG